MLSSVFLSSILSNTNEEARCKTGFTEPCEKRFYAQHGQMLLRDFVVAYFHLILDKINCFNR